MKRTIIGLATLAGSAAAASAQCYFTQVSAVPTISVSSVRAMFDTARSRPMILDSTFLFGTTPTRLYGWTGSSWTLLTSAGPGPRHGLTAAYDAARDRVVVYGGFASQSLPNLPPDVWEWNGTSWAVIPSEDPTVGRYQHAMVYDAARQRVVMFGGIYYGTVANDILEWNGSVWQEYPAPIRPPARRSASMTYDSDRARVVVFSGYAADNSILGDLWEWDGTTWTQRTVVPSTRLAQVTYDANRHRLLVTGGSSGSQSISEVWEFDGATGNWSLVGDFGPTLSTGSGYFDPLTQRVGFASGIGLRHWNATGSVIPPWISSQPQGGTYVLGDTAVMFVGTSGSAPFYEWRKDGVPVVNGGNISGADGPLLTIQSLTPADTGDYRAFLSNACGDATSQIAQVRVGAVCGQPGCYANCDQSTACPTLSANDFQCFLNAYAANFSYANCDGSTSIPRLTANDFQCYLNAYAAGCS